jgi:hypothetical protein
VFSSFAVADVSSGGGLTGLGDLVPGRVLVVVLPGDGVGLPPPVGSVFSRFEESSGVGPPGLIGGGVACLRMRPVGRASENWIPGRWIRAIRTETRQAQLTLALKNIVVLGLRMENLFIN